MTTTISTIISRVVALAVADPSHGALELDEATAIAKRFLPSVHDALLASYPWHFAKWTCFPPVTEAFDFIDLPYAYRLPADCIRITKVRPICSPRPLRYQVRGNYVHTTTNVAVIEFISRIPIEECPAYYLSALVVHLATELAIPLTGSTATWERLRGMAGAERRTAQFEDTNHQETLR